MSDSPYLHSSVSHSADAPDGRAGSSRTPSPLPVTITEERSCLQILIAVKSRAMLGVRATAGAVLGGLSARFCKTRPDLRNGQPTPWEREPTFEAGINPVRRVKIGSYAGQGQRQQSGVLHRPGWPAAGLPPR